MKLISSTLLTLVCLLALSSTQKTKATLNDFSRRFGANSHITHVPLWFKRGYPHVPSAPKNHTDIHKRNRKHHLST